MDNLPIDSKDSFEPGSPGAAAWAPVLWSYCFGRSSQILVRTRQEIEARLIDRCLRDETFRQELLRSPKALVEAEISAPLPDRLEIVAIEKAAGVHYLVLPDRPDAAPAHYEHIAVVAAETEEETADIFGRCVARAWRDPQFRHALLADPRRAIARDLGVALPDDFEILVLPETADLCFLVVPDGSGPAAYDRQLSPRDFEMIAPVTAVSIGQPTFGQCGTVNCHSPSNHPMGC
jgi:hypothetical protein